MIYNYYNPYMIQQPFTSPFRPGIPPFGPGRPIFDPGGRPPFDGPGFPDGRPPFDGPGAPDGPPTSPPPSFIPETTPFRVDPGSIRRCRRRYTYVWLENGQQFWFYPIFIGRTSIAGYRWIGFMWIYFGIDLRQIQSFVCY